MLLGVQTFHVLKNCAKMQKIPKNSKIHFRIPRPHISLKQFPNICENVFFFYYVGGGVE